MLNRTSTNWSPLDLHNRFSFTFGSYALMILNCPIKVEAQVLGTLWEKAEMTSTIDGGTDRWFKFLEETKVTVQNRFPEIVSGDFDSIKPETLSLCKAHGCHVVNTPDQDYTDFEKGLRALTSHLTSPVDSIVTVCECSGRIDQTLSNLNTLRLSVDLPGHPSLFILTAESLTWHLTRGAHTIHIPQHLRDSHQWCAILPFEPKENKVTTTGLKWNLDEHTIKFGGLISSSNTYDGSEVVTLDTDAELLWSMGL